MSILSAGTSNTTSLIYTGDTTGAMVFQTNGTTEAMRITAAQKVGIGVTSPNFKLGVNNTVNDFALGLYDNTTYPYGFGIRPAQLMMYAAADGILSFGHMGTMASTTFTERVRIDTSGRVTMPYQPVFHAVSNGSTPTSGSTLLFQVERTNIGNCYNASTSTFTAPIAGTYYIYGAVMANTGTGRLYWRMNKNGSFVQYMQGGGDSTNYGEWFGCMTITLAAGDYINCILTSGTPYPSNQEQYFGGYLIG